MRRRAFAITALPLALLTACAMSDPMGVQLAAQPVRVVFFEDDSIALGEEARAVVRDAAQVALRYPGAPVRVLGFSAPEVDHAPIMALSRARAEHVAAELVRAGLPRGRIEMQGRGPVAFDVLPVQSRRVEIHLGGN
jgi:outer membrane protein OmpA-like peptidoglycan-associated protein